jgi:arginyl-tRNA synthetase
MLMERQARDIVEKAVQKLGIENVIVEFEIPREEKFGDLATPVAMSLSKILKKAPRIIAEEIVNLIEKDVFERIDIAGPGFINFMFSKDYLFSQLRRLLSERAGFIRTEDRKSVV